MQVFDILLSDSKVFSSVQCASSVVIQVFDILLSGSSIVFSVLFTLDSVL